MSPSRGSCLAAVAFIAAIVPSSGARAARCPNVMLVLDRSVSMTEPPDANGKATKWELLQNAVHRVIGEYGERVPFGLEIYAFTPIAFPDDMTCYAETKIDVEPAHGTGPEILRIIDAAMPAGGTNTGEAIKRAGADAALHDSTRSNFIILITDGDPNCNRLDSCPSCGAAFTVTQIQAAAANDIHTFVVGFDGSKGVSPANLNAMAKAGLEPQNMGNCGSKQQPCYYSASDAHTFDDAIDKIVNQVVSGEFGNMTECDDSCSTNGCPEGQICVTGESDLMPRCRPDPCAAGVQCDPGRFCRGGTCVAACLTPCPKGQSCFDGVCGRDWCNGVECPLGLLCNPLTGVCGTDPCLGQCPAGQICDVSQTRCVDDLCRWVKCPHHTKCVRGGNCEAFHGDGGLPQQSARPDSCAMGRGQDPGRDGGGVLGGLLLVALGLLAARRHHR